MNSREVTQEEVQEGVERGREWKGKTWEREAGSVIKYVRAFLIRSLRAQFVDDFAGPLVQLVEMLSLGDAHAASRVTPDTVEAGVQISARRRKEEDEYRGSCK